MRERDRYRITSVCAHAFTRRERESQFKESEKKKVKARKERERETERFLKNQREKWEKRKTRDTFRAQSLKRNETRFSFFERKRTKKRASASS